MKRILESGLVIVLTIMSVTAMITVKGDSLQEEPVFFEEDNNNSGKPEGTGYLFEDFDKEINIPFEEKKEEVKPDKENGSSQIEDEKFKKNLERNMSRTDDGRTYLFEDYKKNVTTYKRKDIRGESKVIISKVQNNISFEDKITLFQIVKKLSLKDLNDIKNAIFNGTTNAESIKLWTMLRTKLPDNEYKKLENIIAKYE